MAKPQEIAEGLRFDAYAESYDACVDHPIRSTVRETAVSIARSKEPSFVVDIGCGTGTALIDLSPILQYGKGFDVSRKMIAAAREKADSRNCNNLEFEFGSFHDFEENQLLQKETGAPDLILATYSLHHLTSDDKKRVFKALTCHLSTNGTIIIGDLMFFEDPTEYKADYAKVGYNPVNDRPETVDALSQMLEDLSFEVEAVPVHPIAGVIVAERKRD